ncbi:MAG: M23 family metallopeptidase, partial [Acidimicrobiales bacterium]
MGHTRAVLVAPLVALIVAMPAAAAPRPAEPVAYRPPVPGPVIDPFRAPSTPYGPGNRGIDYATTPGEPVGAPADGVVTFAGAVAGGLHVVILHRDGIRTSLSFLAAITVTRDQQVVAGQTVGHAASSVHLGARQGEVYLDPATLFTDRAGGRSVLVPDGPARPLGVEEEAAGLRELLAGIAAKAAPPSMGDLSAGARSAAARSAAEVAALVRAAATVGAPPGWVVLAAAASALADQGPCTAPGSPAPPRPPGRRLLVLVGGLGSSSTAASVFDLDTATLGYEPSEVLRFSYRGGTTAENRYEPADTLKGIEAPAARRAALHAPLSTGQ